jgi:AcrR family transcriptional regulator
MANSTNQHISVNTALKRQQIVEGAISIFLQHGYEGTGMNQVADAAGVTKQTIYSHFGDKEGLFIAIIQELTQCHERRSRSCV